MTEKEKNPKRVAAGRANRAKRGPLSKATKAKLRAAIQQTRPWLYSTGPTTPEGKRRSASNVRMRTAFIDGTMDRKMEAFLKHLEDANQQINSDTEKEDNDESHG